MSHLPQFIKSGNLIKYSSEFTQLKDTGPLNPSSRQIKDRSKLWAKKLFNQFVLKCQRNDFTVQQRINLYFVCVDWLYKYFFTHYYSERVFMMTSYLTYSVFNVHSSDWSLHKERREWNCVNSIICVCVALCYYGLFTVCTAVDLLKVTYKEYISMLLGSLTIILAV